MLKDSICVSRSIFHETRSSSIREVTEACDHRRCFQLKIDYFRPFIKLISPVMLQLPDLYISDNMQLIFAAVAYLGVVGAVAQAYLPRSEKRLPLPPSPETWRLRGHFLPPRK